MYSIQYMHLCRVSSWQVPVSFASEPQATNSHQQPPSLLRASSSILSLFPLRRKLQQNNHHFNSAESRTVEGIFWQMGDDCSEVIGGSRRARRTKSSRPEGRYLEVHFTFSHSSKKRENWRRLLFSSEKLAEKVRTAKRQNSAEKVC